MVYERTFTSTGTFLFWMGLLIYTEEQSKNGTVLISTTNGHKDRRMRPGPDNILQRPSHPSKPFPSPLVQDCEPAASDMRCSLALANDLFSPCLPFCDTKRISIISKVSSSLLWCGRSKRMRTGPSKDRKGIVPPTWRIGGPFLLFSQQQVSCPPSGSGAQRGLRPRGSGCS